MKPRKDWMAFAAIMFVLVLVAMFLTLIIKPFPLKWLDLAVVIACIVATLCAGVLFAGAYAENPKGHKYFIMVFVVLTVVMLFVVYLIDTDKSVTALNNYSDTNSGQVDNEIANEAADEQNYALNEKPADETIIDNELWNDSLKEGVMVGESGRVWYAQTGKKGTKVLHGYIKEGEVLEVDAYKLKLDGKKYEGGCILMKYGPLDLDQYEIVITDGDAQYTDRGHAQMLLDENIAVKFARGDRTKDDSSWTYKPWALEKDQIWLPDGLEWNPLKLTEETDNYPI